MTDPDRPEDRFQQLMHQFNDVMADGSSDVIRQTFVELLREVSHTGFRDGMEASAALVDVLIENTRALPDPHTNLQIVQVATAEYIRDQLRLIALQVS